MTIYSTYILLSIFIAVILIITTLFRPTSVPNRVGFIFLASSLIGVFTLELYFQLSERFIPPVRINEPFYLLATIGFYSLFFLATFQNGFEEKHKKFFWVLTLNTSALFLILFSRFLYLGFLDISPVAIENYTYISNFLLSLVALIILHQKFLLFAELEQARLSSFFMSSMIIFIFLAIDCLSKSINLKPFIYFLLTPYLWIISKLIVNRRIVLIEAFLKNLILKTTCILIYFFVYLFAKRFLTSTFPGFDEKGHLFFSAFLFFTFFSYTTTVRLLEAFFKEFLFRPMINYHLLFRSFSNVILSMVDVDKITDMVVKMFYDVYGIERVSLFMYHPDTDTFKLKTSIGVSLPDLPIDANHPLITYIKGNFRVVRKKEVMVR